MKSQNLKEPLLTAIESQLMRTIELNIDPEYSELRTMLYYHMGWEGPGAGPDAQGKRIRPMIVLLSAIAVGSNWEDFLPIAAAVELVHNFSLIHDDIEDNSELRRGRKTVWVKWGIPQAINAGDLLFTIAHTALIDQKTKLGDTLALEAAKLLHNTCKRLTQGQFLDMDFENRELVTIDDYWRMISGKTAALISCCAELGAIQADLEIRRGFREFGQNLGLAFQIQDDILGLWGESAITGKSNESDLTSGKKSLPILYALKNNKDFYKRWQQGKIPTQEASEIANILRQDGTFAFSSNLVSKYTHTAMQHLHSTRISNGAMSILLDIADQLVGRMK